jgi:subfamily B ATP-binding cassette protein MsbA
MKRRQLVRELFLQPLAAQRHRIFGIVLSLIILSASQALFLLLVKGFIKALFQSQGVSQFSLLELLPEKSGHWLPQLKDVTITTENLSIAVPISILLAGLTKSLASYLYQLNQQGLALYLAKNYRERLFRALLGLPFVEICKKPVGAWMSLIMNDVMLLQSRFTDILTSLVRDSVAVVGCFVILSVVHWPSAVVLGVLSPLIAFGMGRTGKRIAKFAEVYQRELGRIAASLLDFRSRFDFIRSQQGESVEKSSFHAVNRAYYAMIRRSIMVRSAFAPVLEFFGFSVFAGAVYAIGHGYLGHFTPDLMLQFFVALGLLLRPLREIGEQLARYHETKGALASSIEVFEAMITHAQNDAVASPYPSLNKVQKQAVIKLTEIKAGMDGKCRFQAENLELNSGKTVAVIGPSGSGKSTLLKTLAGLAHPISWRSDCNWSEFASRVSMVSQDPFLFDDTLRENLIYGLETDQIPSDEEIWAALATVNIADEVKSWPLGLMSRLRAIGSNISGGQLQRLVIARAILRRRPFWLLDEATAAVDVRSERDITMRLIEASQREHRVMLAVTHRLTWLSAFDQVWFVEDGRVTMVGPHEDLLKHPRYRDYVAASGGLD